LGEGERSWVSDLIGLRGRGPGVEAKWERFPWPKLKPLFDSVCLRKASNSGFESIGKCFGEGFPNERIDDVGGLQLSFGPSPELRGSVAGSRMRPK